MLPLAFLKALSPSERVLGLALVFALPVFGALLAVLALEHGNGDLVSDLAQAPPLPRTMRRAPISDASPSRCPAARR